MSGERHVEVTVRRGGSTHALVGRTELVPIQKLQIPEIISEKRKIGVTFSRLCCKP